METERLETEKGAKDKQLDDVKDQLNQKKLIIKEKEKNIKDLKNYSEHLDNFKFVLHHKIKSLRDEKAPMEEQVKVLEQHIRNMYNELAEETTKNKNLDQKLKDSNSKDINNRCLAQYMDMQKEMKRTMDQVTFAKRRLEMMQYDITNVLRTVNPKDWSGKISEIVLKYSGPKLNGKVTSHHKLSKSQNNHNDDSESDSEVGKVKGELIRQRNWLSKRLKRMTKPKKTFEFEKIKAQSENLKQINALRHDNQDLSKRVQTLEKKFKDLCGNRYIVNFIGIKPNDSEDIDRQIEKFLKQASSITTKYKDTPYVTLKKETNKTNRNQLLENYYQQVRLNVIIVQYTSIDQKAPTNQTMMPMGGNQRRNINNLIGDMEKNHTTLQNQNLELKILRDQVSNFVQFTESPGMMKSGSQPHLHDNPL